MNFFSSACKHVSGIIFYDINKKTFWLVKVHHNVMLNFPIHGCAVDSFRDGRLPSPVDLQWKDGEAVLHVITHQSYLFTRYFNSVKAFVGIESISSYSLWRLQFQKSRLKISGSSLNIFVRYRFEDLTTSLERVHKILRSVKSTIWKKFQPYANRFIDQISFQSLTCVLC